MINAEATRERLLDQWAQQWSSHDADGLLTLFTDDVVYEDVTLGVVNRGKDELRTFAQQFFGIFPDVTLEITSRFVTASRGGIEWVLRGTHQGDSPGLPATGKSVEVRGVAMVEFASEKIRRCSDYYDMATLLKQMGLMPSAG